MKRCSPTSELAAAGERHRPDDAQPQTIKRLIVLDVPLPLGIAIQPGVARVDEDVKSGRAIAHVLASRPIQYSGSMSREAVHRASWGQLHQGSGPTNGTGTAASPRAGCSAEVRRAGPPRGPEGDRPRTGKLPAAENELAVVAQQDAAADANKASRLCFADRWKCPAGSRSASRWRDDLCMAAGDEPVNWGRRTWPSVRPMMVTSGAEPHPFPRRSGRRRRTQSRGARRGAARAAPPGPRPRRVQQPKAPCRGGSLPFLGLGGEAVAADHLEGLADFLVRLQPRALNGGGLRVGGAKAGPRFGDMEGSLWRVGCYGPQAVASSPGSASRVLSSPHLTRRWRRAFGHEGQVFGKADGNIPRFADIVDRSGPGRGEVRSTPGYRLSIALIFDGMT